MIVVRFLVTFVVVAVVVGAAVAVLSGVSVVIAHFLTVGNL